VDERRALSAGLDPRLDTGPNQDDEISLRPYFDMIWRQRQIVLAATVGVGVLFILAAIALVILSPAERIASIPFRLLFEGAAENKYPNDTPFSPTEIVAAPVLTEVFQINDLQRFGKFDVFKDTVFVLQSNPQIDQLEYEFAARLSDSKLTPVDRARIEADFKSKRDALTDPSFTLTLRRSERFTVMPRDLAQKVLTDTLATWARQAELRKGVMRYNIAALSSKLLSRQMLEDSDYLVGADQLRAKAVRIINTVDELEKVPGANALRPEKEDISLPEIRATLEDVLRFELEPLLGIIRSEGVSKNARLVSLYASNMVFQLELDKQESDARARALQTSLREYSSQTGSRATENGRPNGGQPQSGLDTPGLMPQLTESFLDRLQSMSALTQKGELEYRRKLTDQTIKEATHAATLDKEVAYYKGLLKSVEGIGNRPAGSPELVALIKTRSAKAFDVIEKATNQLSVLYQEISRHNLNPTVSLYAVTGPFTDRTQYSRPFSRLALLLLFVMLGTFVAMSAAVLVYSLVRRKPVPAPRPPALT
jgi:hypothetical protein